MIGRARIASRRAGDSLPAAGAGIISPWQSLLRDTGTRVYPEEKADLQLPTHFQPFGAERLDPETCRAANATLQPEAVFLEATQLLTRG